jgi:hypothetical protein
MVDTRPGAESLRLLVEVKSTSCHTLTERADGLELLLEAKSAYSRVSWYNIIRHLVLILDASFTNSSLLYRLSAQSSLSNCNPSRTYFLFLRQPLSYILATIHVNYCAMCPSLYRIPP